MTETLPNNVVDLHREVSIQLLKSTTAFAVRTPRGQKDPGHYKWDPKTNNLEKSHQTIFQLERGDDNPGIHLHGKVVDVDIDTDNPVLTAALDHFLPHTAHVWGRASRPRTHRLYEVTGVGDIFQPSDFGFLEVIQKYPELNVELRGGEPKNAQYSLLPGALHPSGEAYTWHDIGAARSTLVAVDGLKLVAAVRLACVAALIVPYWIEGQRNQMCMALSGFLHRAAQHVQDMGNMSGVFFDKNEATRLLRGIMELAGDDHTDYTMRMKTFEKTWQKADEGQAVQGASTIAKITERPEIVSLLYILLADSQDLIELDEFMERYAIRNNTSSVIDLQKAGSKGAVYIMSVHDLRNSTMHKLLTAGGQARLMANVLLASPRAIRVEGFCFRPGYPQIVEEYGERLVNQWRGFDVQPWQEPVTEEDIKPFLDYLWDIVADQNATAYDWILSWVADIFKDPNDKPGTALVLVGKPGSGKSVLGAHFIRRIIGKNHTTQTNAIESLTNNFNADSSNVLFIQCDEAMNTRRRADALRMKSMITDKTRRIEPKGVDAYEVEDCARYYLTSNEVTDAVAIVDGADDRRYTVQHVSEKYAHRSEMPLDKKQEYWRSLYKWGDNIENLSKLHRYFIDLDYDKMLIRSPLSSKARDTMQQHSQRGFDDWLMQIASYEHPLQNLRQQDQRTEESYVYKGNQLRPTMSEWPQYVAYMRLEESYEMYLRRKGMRATTTSFNAQQIKNEFVSKGLLLPNPDVKRVDHRKEVWVGGESVLQTERIRITRFPAKEAILKYLHERYGFEIDEVQDVDVTKDEGISERPDTSKPNF